MRLKRRRIVATLTTVVLAGLVGAAVFDFQYDASLPGDRLLERSRLDGEVVELASPDGTLKAVNYFLEDDSMPSGASSVVVVVPSAEETQERTIYYGPPADVSWQGNATIVAREMGSGEVHRLDPAAGFYHWRISGLANKLFTAALVSGAILAVLALGLGCSWAISRLRSRLVEARLPR